jgi:hypothetical protein
MTNADWIDMLRLIPPEQHNILVLMTNTGIELSAETIFRLEPSYLVVRGRLSGNNDGGRVFFVPYDQITYINLNRVVSENDVRRLYSEATEPEMRSPCDVPANEPDSSQEMVNTMPLSAMPTASSPAAVSVSTATPVNRPSGPEAAAAAKNVLLERIRAARAGLTHPPGRSGG